jgi:hypothetical protein
MNMKKISIIVLAATMFASCGNSSSNQNGAPGDSTLDVAGTDTSQGYNSNSGNVNTQTGNTMTDSSLIDSSRKMNNR